MVNNICGAQVDTVTAMRYEISTMLWKWYSTAYVSMMTRRKADAGLRVLGFANQDVHELAQCTFVWRQEGKGVEGKNFGEDSQF
jgi:hypothetical protein